MPIGAHTDHFDLDIELRDASCDLNVLPARRAIAALCIGVGVDDAYFSVRELREAVSLVHENAPGGRAKLASILSTSCDDFQRAIYFCLAGRGVVEMADAMDWLLAMLKARVASRVSGICGRRSSGISSVGITER